MITNTFESLIADKDLNILRDALNQPSTSLFAIGDFTLLPKSKMDLELGNTLGLGFSTEMENIHILFKWTETNSGRDYSIIKVTKHPKEEQKIKIIPQGGTDNMITRIDIYARKFHDDFTNRPPNFPELILSEDILLFHCKNGDIIFTPFNKPSNMVWVYFDPQMILKFHQNINEVRHREGTVMKLEDSKDTFIKTYESYNIIFSRSIV